MICSIDKCEHIKRTSVLLSKYHEYQSILHPKQICNEDEESQTQQSITQSQNGYNDETTEAFDTPIEDNTAGVAFVDTIDGYNDDLIQYDDEDQNQDFDEMARDSQNEDPEDEAQENEDILTYFDRLNGQIKNILDDYNHIIINHYNEV